MNCSKTQKWEMYNIPTNQSCRVCQIYPGMLQVAQLLSTCYLWKPFGVVKKGKVQNNSFKGRDIKIR